MSTGRVLPFVSESNESARFIERYRKAYELARSTTGFAETIKLVLMFAGGVFVVAAR